jgi:metal-responsive CopG/Arc/MetJ family transcriptional regulator
MEKLQRTQVLLEPTQHKSLSKLAQSEGRSMSDLIREAVAEYLVERVDINDSWQESLAELSRIREQIQAKHGVLPAEFILDLRAEREEEIWQRMMGEE